jgi:MFS transporter, FSR family, fosmidomycin resistance protein
MAFLPGPTSGAEDGAARSACYIPGASGAAVELVSKNPRSSPRIGPFLAVTAGHFAIDIWNSMGPVLVAFLRAPLGLSGAEVGLAVGSYQFLAGVTQPAFGWLADRMGSRVMGPASVAWTIGLVTLALAVAVRTASYGLFLALFALAALGSGAFHPQGVMHSSRAAAASRTATATAIFFLCGQVGLAGGPVLSGFLLERSGPRGIYALALITVPVAALMAIGLRGTTGTPIDPAPAADAATRSGGAARGVAGERYTTRRGVAFVVALLAVIFTCRGWVTIGTAAFLPALFEAAGWSPSEYGIVTGLYWLGAGVSGVVAGRVADRWGRRPVVATTTFAGACLLVALPIARGSWAFAVALLAGALMGSAHSILIVMAQAYLPVRQGLASGLALGYLFGAGALSSVAIGLLADTWGLAPVIQGGAAIGVLAAVLTAFLPSSRSQAASGAAAAAPPRTSPA